MVKKFLPFTLSMVISFYGVSQSDSLDVLNMSLEDLMNVEVNVATKTGKTVDEAPGTIRVITRQQITDMNARTLKDVLNVFVPGMLVLPTTYKYGDRVETAYNRGIPADFSQQVLYLLNGKNKMNESTWGQPFEFAEITLENIDRIEVSTSPIPLQGASAITTINIITREQNLNGTEVFVNTGFDKANGLLNKKITLSSGGTIKGWHVGSSLQYYDDKGQAHPDSKGSGSYPGSLSELRDGIKGSGNFSFNIKSPKNNLEFHSWYKTHNSDAFLSGLVPSQSNNTYNYYVNMFQNYLVVKPIKGLELIAGGMLSRFDNFINYGGFPYGSMKKSFNAYIEGDYTFSFNAGGKHNILSGFKLEREGQYASSTSLWVDSTAQFSTTTDQSLTLAPNLKRNAYSIYGEDTWSISEKFEILGGARFDYYNNFAGTNVSAINPRLALSYSATKKIIFKLLYASAFRPPTIYELTGTSLFPLFGDKNLKNERVQTFEANAIVKTGGLKLQLSPYYMIYDNKITYIQQDQNINDGVDTLKAGNAPKTNVTGVDITAHYYFNASSYVFINASKFITTDKISANTKILLPDFYLNGGFNINYKKLDLNTTFNFRGVQKIDTTISSASTKLGKAHFSCNLSLSYAILPAIKIYTLIENLANQQNFIPTSARGLFVPIRSRIFNIGIVGTF